MNILSEAGSTFSAGYLNSKLLILFQNIILLKSSTQHTTHQVLRDDAQSPQKKLRKGALEAPGFSNPRTCPRDHRQSKPQAYPRRYRQCRRRAGHQGRWIVFMLRWQGYRAEGIHSLRQASYRDPGAGLAVLSQLTVPGRHSC